MHHLQCRRIVRYYQEQKGFLGYARKSARARVTKKNALRSCGVLCQHPLFYRPFPKDCWGLFDFQYTNTNQLRIPKIFREWQILQNTSFSLDIFILVCWAIWVMRNDIVFRNKTPSIDDCKRTITVESLLLLHRTKAWITPILEAWTTYMMIASYLLKGRAPATAFKKKKKTYMMIEQTVE